MFIEIENTEGKTIVINSRFVVRLTPKDNYFGAGATIELSKESVDFSSIHLGADQALKLRNRLLEIKE